MQNAYEKVFLKQVFYGCVRYEPFLKAFLKVFFIEGSSPAMTPNRKDSHLYSIFAYLTLFRLDELQLEDFKRIIMSQDIVKMHGFLQFIFDIEKLKTHV